MSEVLDTFDANVTLVEILLFLLFNFLSVDQKKNAQINKISNSYNIIAESRSNGIVDEQINNIFREKQIVFTIRKK